MAIHTYSYYFDFWLIIEIISHANTKRVAKGHIKQVTRSHIK